MSKTLSFVGILAIVASAGIYQAVGQTGSADTPTTEPTHMTDAERDRLMQEAIDKARKDQDAAAKEEAPPFTPVPTSTPSPTVKAELSSTPSPAGTKAQNLADDANFPKAKPKKTESDGSAYNLAPLKLSEKTVDLDSVKATPATTPKPDLTPKPATVKVEPTPRPVEKAVVVEDSDKPRDSDKPVNFNEKDLPDGTPVKEPARAQENSSTLRGVVVGIMMPTGRDPRILLRDYSGRQVEVTLDEDLDVPAPQSAVSLSGRETATRGMGLRTFEATSVRLESGRFMQTMPTRQPVPVAPGPVMPGPFVPGPPVFAPPMMVPPRPF